jgi:hypothetical protein
VTFKLHRLVKKKLPNKQNPFLFITASQPKLSMYASLAWQNDFSHPSLVILLFSNLTHKTGLQNRWGRRLSATPPETNQTIYPIRNIHREQSIEYDQSVLLIRLFQGAFLKAVIFFQGSSEYQGHILSVGGDARSFCSF